MKRTLNILALVLLFNFNLFANTNLLKFELEDQFEKVYTQDNFLGEVFVIIGASTDVLNLHKNFKIKLKKELLKNNLDNIKLVSVFDMQQVPALFRYFAMSKFPSEKKKKILIDWKGKLSKYYAFSNNTLDILVFNKTGKLILHLSKKEIDDPNINAIIINKIIFTIKDIL